MEEDHPAKQGIGSFMYEFRITTKTEAFSPNARGNFILVHFSFTRMTPFALCVTHVVCVPLLGQSKLAIYRTKFKLRQFTRNISGALKHETRN